MMISKAIIQSVPPAVPLFARLGPKSAIGGIGGLQILFKFLFKIKYLRLYALLTIHMVPPYVPLIKYAKSDLKLSS